MEIGHFHVIVRFLRLNFRALERCASLKHTDGLVVICLIVVMLLVDPCALFTYTHQGYIIGTGAVKTSPYANKTWINPLVRNHNKTQQCLSHVHSSWVYHTCNTVGVCRNEGLHGIINSLSRERCASNFKGITFKIIIQNSSYLGIYHELSQVIATVLNWWEFSIGSGNGLMPPDTKRLSGPMFTRLMPPYGVTSS